MLKKRINYYAGAAAVFTVIFLAWIFVVQEAMAVSRAKFRQMSGLERLEYYNNNTEDNDEKLSEGLRIPLPMNYRHEGVVTDVEAIDRIISIYIPNVSENFIYEHPIMGSSAGIEAMEAAASGRGLRVEIKTSQLKEPFLSYENGNMYVSFKDPREIYKRIVVVDPGHGGVDTGMEMGEYKESDLNLKISKYVRDLLEDKDIRVYMTRSSEVATTLEDRVGLANELDADAFISVHCNAEKDDKDVQHGTLVLYNARDTSGASLRLAELCMDGVTKSFGSKRLLCQKGDDIHIIRNSKVPVALVEVGFMTNAEELAKLIDPDNKRNAAAGIIDGVMKAYEKGIIGDD